MDGIRGWGALLVLFFHFIVCFMDLLAPELHFDPLADLHTGNYRHLFYGIFFRFFTDGRLAVLVFFVLSGFALSVSHFNLQRNTLALAAASRYFRLMIPILFTSLFTYVLLKTGLICNVQAAATADKYALWLGSFYRFDPSIGRVLGFSVYDVFFRYRVDTSYNSSLWTMPIELLGSFFIYGYLALFRRTAVVQWKLALLIAVILLEAAPLYACFVMGYLIAELSERCGNRSRPAALDAALSSAFVVAALISTSARFRGDDRITCLIATCLVASATFSTSLRTVFSSRLSGFLGRISFPLYLIQIPVICSLSSYLLIELPRLGVAPRAAILVNFSVTLFACVLLSSSLLPVDRFGTHASRRIGGLLLAAAKGGP